MASPILPLSIARAHSSRNSNSFWTRSTIYNRNERRRAKTLQNQHNTDTTRHPAMRVLAQLAGTSAVAAAATTTVAVASSEKIASSPKQSNDQPLSIVMDDDTTIFTTTPASAAYQQQQQQQPNHPSILTAAVEAGISAAIGARLAESMTQKLLWGRSSSEAVSSAVQQSVKQQSHHHHHHHNVVFNGSSSLALSIPHHQQSSTNTSTTNSKTPLRRPLPNPFYFYSAATVSSPSATASSARFSGMFPLAVLFGTKQFVQQHLEHILGEDSTHQPISLASLTASVAAGTAMGVVQLNAFTHHPWSFHLATEAASAVLYFETYALLKAAFLGKQQQQQLPQNSDHHTTRSLAAIPLAGAAAGSLYEMLRVLGTSEWLTLANPIHSTHSPFVARPLQLTMGPIITRAAPAHACLWLAYETVQSVVFGNNNNHA